MLPTAAIEPAEDRLTELVKTLSALEDTEPCAEREAEASLIRLVCAVKVPVALKLVEALRILSA